MSNPRSGAGLQPIQAASTQRPGAFRGLSSRELDMGQERRGALLLLLLSAEQTQGFSTRCKKEHSSTAGIFLDRFAYRDKHDMQAEDKTLLSGLLLYIKAMSQALSHLSVRSEMHEQRLNSNKWPILCNCKGSKDREKETRGSLLLV